MKLKAWCQRDPQTARGGARRLRQLEEENQRLKRLVADQALDIQVLKAV
ncbi:hypothetical protein ACFSHT_30175 [Paraburkholderia silviterrae]|nr:hypothetical protein [Paraburkholderia silviterrae]